MSDTLDPILLNFIYACFGGFLTLFFMWFGCKVFSHIVNFSIPDELAKGNLAVGLMIYVLLGIPFRSYVQPLIVMTASKTTAARPANPTATRDDEYPSSQA